MQSETQREAMIRARRFGSCAKCGGAQGHDYALGGVFCTNPKCGQDTPPAESAGLVERLKYCDEHGIFKAVEDRMSASYDEAVHHIAAQDAEIARKDAALERCAKIVEQNLYHQHEKIEDVPRLLRAALNPETGHD